MSPRGSYGKYDCSFERAVGIFNLSFYSYVDILIYKYFKLTQNI